MDKPTRIHVSIHLHIEIQKFMNQCFNKVCLYTYCKYTISYELHTCFQFALILFIISFLLLLFFFSLDFYSFFFFLFQPNVFSVSFLYDNIYKFLYRTIPYFAISSSFLFYITLPILYTCIHTYIHI